MKSLRIVVPAVVAVGAASAISYAAAGSGDTINGCLEKGKSKSTVRVISGSGKCSKNEVAISWSKTGPEGAPGPRDEAGPRGETGPAGPAGQAGPGSAPEALLFGGRALEGAAVDAYLKLDGVDGESRAAGYEGQTEVLAFRFSIDSDSGFGGGGGAPVLSRFRFTTLADKASPVLAKKALQGVHFASGQLSFVRSTSAGPRQFMTVKFTSATVTHWELGGVAEPSRLLRFDLNPSSFEIGYRPVDAQGGLGGEVKFSYNRATTAIG